MARAKKSATSTRKPAAKPSARARASASAASPAAGGSAGQTAPEKGMEKAAEATAPALRRKALIEAAVLRSGRKKRDVKPVVEAVLAILGEALARGEQLNLPPFGKLNVKRRSEKENAEVFTCRIRRAKNDSPGA